MSIKKPVYDIIIVGGGIAGLYMAYKLRNTNKSILIIEKDSRYGGRIETKYNQNGNEKLQYDAGPARISRNHNRTLQLIKSLKLETIKIKPNKEYKHIHSDKTVEIQNDISAKYSKYIIKESAKYSKTYLQSVKFVDLCEQILGIEKTQEFKNMFGYDAEFTYCNAYDAIEMFKKDFQNIGTYFVMKDGLSSVINTLLDKLKEYSHITLVQNTEIKKFKYVQSTQLTRLYTTHTSNKSYDSGIIIWAIPKNPLAKINGWSKSQQDLFNSVEPISLHRIFCQFPHKNGKSWLSTVPRTTTNDGLRQIIPLNGEKGFTQLYSDSYWADYWNIKYTHSKKDFIQELVLHLHTVFPEYKTIPEPTYIDSVYWSEGVHMWKAGFNSDIYYDKIQHVSDTTNSNPTVMFIIGEAFSKHQCWIEGAIESADDVYSSVIKTLC